MDQTNENKTNNQEEEPGEYLFISDDVPDVSLIRVNPYSHIGSYIFREPDKECDEEKSK